MKLSGEEQAAFDYLSPTWELIPEIIRPDDQILKQAIADHVVQNQVLANALEGRMPEKKPANHFSLRSGARLAKSSELGDKSVAMAFHNAITRLEMIGLDPLQDLQEYGLNKSSAFNSSYLAENLFTALPLLADCLHMTFSETEKLPDYGYGVMSIEEHLSTNIGIKTSLWKSYDLGRLVYLLLKKLPQGTTSTNGLIAPLEHLQSLTAEKTFVHYLAQKTLKQLKKKELLLGEKAMRALRDSITKAVENWFRETSLLVPYPRNPTLDLLHYRKTLQNTVLVHPPLLYAQNCPITHKELEEAIFRKKLKVYTNNRALFKEETGECAIRLPSLTEVKRALVREGLCCATSYDLLVLQLAVIDYNHRLSTKGPLSSLPHEYLLSCQRLFDESWMDMVIATKLQRLLSGMYSMMGDEDMRKA
ncbi:hypothetical protein K493DRAFT_314245, partial [Basidiobolus meristosporus CBS 931.73]